MPIQVKCGCGRQLKLRDELAGKAIRCPGCGGTLLVPLPEAEVAEQASAKQPVRPSVPPRKGEVRVAAGPPPLPKSAPPAAPKPSQKLPVATPPAPPPLPKAMPVELIDENDLVEAIPVNAPLAAALVTPPSPSPISTPPAQVTQIRKEPSPPPRALEPLPEDPTDELLPEFESLEVLDEEPQEQLLKVDGSSELEPEEAVELTEFGEAAPQEPTTYAMSGAAFKRLDYSAKGAIDGVRVRADDVAALAYGADHIHHLAASDRDLFLVDFNESTGERLQPMHSGDILTGAMSPDCQLGLTGDDGGGLLLWDLALKRPKKWLDGHRGAVTAVAFAPDGKHAASAGESGLIRLWNAVTGEMIILGEDQLGEAATAVCFSHDSRLIAVVGVGGKTCIWSVAERKRTGPLQQGSADLHSVGFTQDDEFLLAGSGKKFKTCKWHVESGERQSCFANLMRESKVRKTWVTPGGRCVVSFGYRIIPFVKRAISPDQNVTDFALPGMWIGRMALAQSVQSLEQGLTPDKGTFYLELWDVHNEKSLGATDLGPDEPTGIAVSDDGHRVVVGCPDGTVMLVAL